VLDFVPIRRIVPTTITKITANITAYSAMSCPCSSRHKLQRVLYILSSMGPNHSADSRCCAKLRTSNLDAVASSGVPRNYSGEAPGREQMTLRLGGKDRVTLYPSYSQAESVRIFALSGSNCQTKGSDMEKRNYRC
jgi:hypothetical protein